MYVADYVAKFEELSRFCPHYNAVGAEVSKCVKFERGLQPDIKQFIGFHEIQMFPLLFNKCRIYDEDSKARASYYKVGIKAWLHIISHKKRPPYSNKLIFFF